MMASLDSRFEPTIAISDGGVLDRAKYMNLSKGF